MFTFTVTKYNPAGNKDPVQTAKLQNIRVPVLLAHHEDDACYVTPFENMSALAREFVNLPKVEIEA